MDFPQQKFHPRGIPTTIVPITADFPQFPVPMQISTAKPVHLETSCLNGVCSCMCACVRAWASGLLVVYRAFADRRGYLIMSLSRITIWPTWSLQLSEINHIMYAVKTLYRCKCSVAKLVEVLVLGKFFAFAVCSRIMVIRQCVK